MWGFSPPEMKRELGLVRSSHDRKGGSYKMMNGAGEGKSCRRDGFLPLLFIFAENKSAGRGLELESKWNKKSLHYNWI